MPGVVVEAASPVLIERTRTVVTDGEGAYRDVDLRPGLYAVTFSLPGFTSVRRDGISLPAAFTATVNAELSVGALEETVVVSGAAPLVDVQSVSSERQLSAELSKAFQPPTPQGFAGSPGLSPYQYYRGRSRRNEPLETRFPDPGIALSDHGLNTSQMESVGGANNVFRPSYVSEMNLMTGGGTAEFAFMRDRTNVIPKEGATASPAASTPTIPRRDFSRTT